MTLSGCNTTISPAEQRNVEKEPPKWSVGCQSLQRDSFGKVIGKPKCWTMVTDIRAARDDDPMIAEFVFEVDERGPRIPRGKPALSPCKKNDRQRLGADGRDITGLSQRAQIEAALSATRLVRERAQTWPYCVNRAYASRMVGARAAYDEMIQQWNNRQK